MTRREIERLIDGSATAFVASVDEEGFPCVKAMLAPRVCEGLRTFYFTTNTHSLRVAHFRRNPQASIYFCSEQEFRGVMLRGEMETLVDPQSRRLVWREGDTEYYPEGVDDPDYCVLRFTARDGRTYAGYASESFEIDPLTEGIAGDGSWMTASRARCDGMLIDNFDQVMDRAAEEVAERAEYENKTEKTEITTDETCEL